MKTRKAILLHTTIFLLLATAMLPTNACYGQVSGCTDPLANNYNAAATINNGSCTYDPPPVYTPPFKTIISDSLKESSGLQMAGNFLWSFNDGGGIPAIYRIDTLTNTLLQRVILGGAQNIDWEDIAFDGTNFYIGDFGNNVDGARADLKIYKFPFCAIPDYVTNPVVTIPSNQISIINFSYSDQPLPLQKTTSNNTKFDCEAMIVDSGKIHLFTKNWIDLNSTHYEINGLTAGTYTAMPKETLLTNYLVTGADKAIGQHLVILLGYEKGGFFNHFIHLLTGYSGGNYFNGNKRKINLPTVLTMGQAEGICFRNSTCGYISNEAVAQLSVKQTLRSFDIGSIVSGLVNAYIFMGNGDWNNASNWMNQLAPPTTIAAGSEIIIDPSPCGQCVLNIPYTVSSGAKLTIYSVKNFIVQGNLTLQ
ncbi:MAG: hypothetical protein JWP81_1629 [Ferruginibacter sp.]|nr:hypothetical protein [Ferruginibacter sp.]